ncbi:hypothetical protein [Lactiplantibacillus plantarum]|uniref:hypothetical protein n=1 Tax=Lactiplantibacillus plantarum TaxID=1590 RepID=UPI001BAA9715|nr:hypothetical protein [Lactiplantibacillus plantarum]MBS0954981.1 hypothetical protein [Lactiplantibacillus plantarum]
MIQDISLNKIQVRDLEESLIDDYFKDEDAQKGLSSSLDYYQVLFEQKARNNFDNIRKNENEEIQDKVISSFNIHFVKAMTYAFIKGHQLAFKIVFDEGNTSFKADAFANQNSRSLFLFALYKYFPKNDLEEYIKGPKVNYLINYGTKYFENMFSIIIEDAMVFLKKGIELALTQINQEVHKDSQEKYEISSLLSVPLSQKFNVTPALDGGYALGNKNFEVWDIYWNDTYGPIKSQSRMATMLIKEYSFEELQNNITKQEQRFKVLNLFLSRSQIDVTQNFFYVDFMLIANKENLNVENNDFEKKKMFESLTQKLVDCSNLPVSNILFNM